MIIRQECREVSRIWLVIVSFGAFLRSHNFVLLPMSWNNTSGGMGGYNQARWHVLQEFTIKPETHYGNPIKEEIHEKKERNEKVHEEASRFL